MSNADERRQKQSKEQPGREVVRRDELEKRTKESADAERVLRDLENKLNEERKKE
jgi:hypothetical protein